MPLLPPPRTPGNESALQLFCNLGKRMRPKCLLKNAYSCHSERSEESWLGSNPAETDETARSLYLGTLFSRGVKTKRAKPRSTRSFTQGIIQKLRHFTSIIKRNHIPKLSHK
jgi:hypothetical protein